MTSSSGRRCWLKTALTIASILGGLPWGVIGCLLLLVSVKCLVTGDSLAGHLSQALTAGLATTLVGGGTVVASIYTLIVTRSFKRWNGELSIRDRIIAYMAMLGVVWNIGFWLYTLPDLLPLL